MAVFEITRNCDCLFSTINQSINQSPHLNGISTWIGILPFPNHACILTKKTSSLLSSCFPSTVPRRSQPPPCRACTGGNTCEKMTENNVNGIEATFIETQEWGGICGFRRRSESRDPLSADQKLTSRPLRATCQEVGWDRRCGRGGCTHRTAASDRTPFSRRTRGIRIPDSSVADCRCSGRSPVPSRSCLKMNGWHRVDDAWDDDVCDRPAINFVLKCAQLNVADLHKQSYIQHYAGPSSKYEHKKLVKWNNSRFISELTGPLSWPGTSMAKISSTNTILHGSTLLSGLWGGSNA